MKCKNCINHGVCCKWEDKKKGGCTLFGEWITVSENLPKWGEEVLTIDNDENYEINHIMDDERNEWFYDNDIVAWMPLPEPYKAESEEVDE